MSEGLIKRIGDKLWSANRILIVSHVRPDGDAIGSLLGLGLSLQAVGKEVQMVIAEGFPSRFRFLQASEQIGNRPEGNFDLTVVLDCSDLKRAGSALEPDFTPDINIDHHPTNMDFAHLNLVEPGATATAELLANYLPEFSLPITQPVAAALLFGLLTDTLGFRTSNITPQALRVAANLMEAGADLPDLYQRGLISRTFEAAKYWGTGLSRLQREGRMAWTSLKVEDRQAAGYLGRDDADLINVLTSLEEIDVVIIFVEQGNGSVKVSWRSDPDLDVSQIALQFGGGGHVTASGAMIPGTLEEVEAKVLVATRTIYSGERA
jgi:phosphoesterase RecJ-like protein